jgi:WRKY DNA -binding domain
MLDVIYVYMFEINPSGFVFPIKKVKLSTLIYHICYTNMMQFALCRSYYRCTQDNCRVKKRIERLAEDPRMVITTYEGRHAHSPSHDDEEPQTSSQMNFLW